MERKGIRSGGQVPASMLAGGDVSLCSRPLRNGMSLTIPADYTQVSSD